MTCNTDTSLRPAALQTGRVDTELREILAEQHDSAVTKYMKLCVGRTGWLALMNYELRMGLLASLPGALGLVARQRLYRGLWHRCGRNVVIGRNVTIRHPHRIVLGDNVIIDDNCVLDGKGTDDVTIAIGDNAIIGRNTTLSCKGGTIRVGEKANISVNCSFISESELIIGRKVLVAGHCYAIAGGNHGIARTDIPVVEQPCLTRGGVHIDDHAWLGAGVVVLDGVRVGRDAVVGAGAVLTRSIDPFTVAAGVPGRVLRHREEQCHASQ